MTSQIIELSVLHNKTVSSLKSVVDSARNRRRTMFALGINLIIADVLFRSGATSSFILFSQNKRTKQKAVPFTTS